VPAGIQTCSAGNWGSSGPPTIGNDPQNHCRNIRASGIEAATRQATPKIAFVAPPRDYVTSSGKAVRAAEVDLLVRALSMGQLHHAMMGTAAVAIGAAAAVPGTLVNLAAGGGERSAVRFGHPSGMLGRGGRGALHRRPVGRHQGADEPQHARADGRLGGGAGMSAAQLPEGLRSQ
jgi:PrpF protein